MNFLALQFFLCWPLLAAGPAPLISKRLVIDGLPYQYRAYRPGSPGLFFFTPSRLGKSPGKNSLVVLDAQGEVVFHRAFRDNEVLADFKELEPGLYGYFNTLIDPTAVAGRRETVTYHFLDRDFREVFPRPVPAGDADLDMHEAARARNGNLLFLFYRGSGKEGLIDAEIQEWDPAGKVVFKWNSKDHLLPPADSSSPMDYLHANSIAQDADGGLLLSLGAPSEIIKIAYPRGTVLWRLSDRGWRIADDPLKGFRSQHTAARLPNGNILLYDNGGGARGETSRAIEYRLDEASRTATMVWEYRMRPGDAFRPKTGSAQRLADGNTVIGWGEPDLKALTGGKKSPRLPLFTEVDAAGDVVRELVALARQVSYRVFFQPKEKP